MPDPSSAAVRSAYLLSEVGGLPEAERLRRQAESLLREDLALILAQVPPQAEVVDVGCGSGTLAAALAAARPDIRVLGCDADALAIQEARRVYGHQERLRFEVQPLQSGPPAGVQADVAILRLVLMHQADTVAALKQARAWLREQGTLYVIEADDRRIELRPAGPWMQRSLQLMQTVQAQRGGDRQLGQSLAQHLGAAGFRSLGQGQTGFDLARLGPDMGPLFLPVLSFYLQEAKRSGLSVGDEAAELLEQFRLGFAGEFDHATVPLFHAWATPHGG